LCQGMPTGFFIPVEPLFGNLGRQDIRGDDSGNQILTIVPDVGIIAGSLLPIAMAWITYDSIWYPLGIAGIFTFVQYREANVIFPIAVSSRLKRAKP